MTVVTYFRTYYSCVRYFYSANEGLVTSQLGEFVQININRHLTSSKNRSCHELTTYNQPQ